MVTSPVEPRSRSALLQWSLPPKKGRNGIITQYIMELWVYVPEVEEFRSIRNITVPNDTPHDSPNITYNVTALTPYTSYAWKVAAVNDAGVGVLTSSIDFTTLQDGEAMSFHCYYTKVATSFLMMCLPSSWSSVKLVLQHNIKHFSSDNVE